VSGVTLPVICRVTDISRFCAFTVVTVTGGSGADAVAAGALAPLAFTAAAELAEPALAVGSDLPEQAASTKLHRAQSAKSEWRLIFVMV